MFKPLVELEKYGQSVWLDNISRDMLTAGELKDLVENEGVKGVTSNPSIFQKAIGKGTHYDEQIKELIENNKGISAKEIFEAAAIKDIQDAADVLFPIYVKTDGIDGYVSIEVAPDLAYDTDRTIEEARRINQMVNRPNVMIKIPATNEGIPAIKQMISEGVSINVTLIFSSEVYEEVVEAYISGLEERFNRGESVENIASVASFFISRIDSAVDKILVENGKPELQGKTAIANAKLAYIKSKELFTSERFTKLIEEGAKMQRLLWASTSTKNPAYPDTLYVEELIGENTVNTMPPDTVKAYKDHGKPESRIENDIKEAEEFMANLASVKIDFELIAEKLTLDGVQLFVDAFTSLLNTIDEKKKSILNLPVVSYHYSNMSSKLTIEKRIFDYVKDEYVTGLVENDFHLWKENKEDDVELSNRLGWLTLPHDMLKEVDSLNAFADEIKSEFTDVVLLGMGGSSLAPEVFFKTFGNKPGYPKLSVLDSTHPENVSEILKLNLNKTLFIVASKSGGTTETMSFFYTFYNALSKTTNPGNNFVAITDPGSSLEKLADVKQFRKVFLTPPNVGGRFSALTFFGLVPAALIGIDIEKLLQRAYIMQQETLNLSNPDALRTGVMLGTYAQTGADKMTILTSNSFSSIPVWIEQLVAESTGKEGKGILPVDGEKFYDTSLYGIDRLFVYILHEKDDLCHANEHYDKITAAGFPAIKIIIKDIYDLGIEFYRWEIATAVAGSVLKINPFDQPNVQLAKTLANQVMESYVKTGKLDGNDLGKPVSEIPDFLFNLPDNSYISLMAFLPYKKEIEKSLNLLKEKLIKKYRKPVTIGFGPRFLHSTGQLHKGDAGKGYFIQFTSPIENDVEVPEKGYSFGTLVTAQAIGDKNALKNQGRKVITINFDSETLKGIELLDLN